MNIKRYCFLTTIILTVVPLLAADVGKRHKETAGGFSYCPPEGWTIRTLPGMKYSIVAGSASKGFAPNINVVDESAEMALAAYVDANKKILSKAFKGYKELGKREFKTTSGLKGARLLIQSDQDGTLVRQAFYFFAGTGDKKFIVICSALASGGDEFDEAFEGSLKTFVLD